MEEPRLLPVLREAAKATGVPLDSSDATFYVGYENVVVRDRAPVSRIPEAIFSYFNRNALHDEEHYGVPPDQIVEIVARLRV